MIRQRIAIAFSVSPVFHRGRQVAGTALRNKRRVFLSRNTQVTIFRIRIYLWRSFFRIDVAENWGSGRLSHAFPFLTFLAAQTLPPTFFSTTWKSLAAGALSNTNSLSTMRRPPNYTVHCRQPNLAWRGAAPNHLVPSSSLSLELLTVLTDNCRFLVALNEAITATAWYMLSTACFRTNLLHAYILP